MALHDLVDAQWRTLIEKDDRTSPEAYPDMALITKEELQYAMDCAVGETQRYLRAAKLKPGMTDDVEGLISKLRAHQCGCGGECGQRTPSYITEAATVIAALQRERDEARGYALGLAGALHKKHFPEAADWKALPDLLGLLTQIDNMSSALTRANRTEP